MRTFTRWLESVFETFLFNSRLIVIMAVIGSLVSSVLMFVRGVMVIWRTAISFLRHVNDAHAGEELSVALISSVDSFLFATVLLIFAMGIYELFISKIDPASRHAESRPNWLQIHSLDDLKAAIGKVILMILIVQLFESAVKMEYVRPLDLLYLGLSVLFVSGALYLQHASHKAEHKAEAAAKGAHAHEGDTHEAPAPKASVHAKAAPPRVRGHLDTHDDLAPEDRTAALVTPRDLQSAAAAAYRPPSNTQQDFAGYGAPGQPQPQAHGHMQAIAHAPSMPPPAQGYPQHFAPQAMHGMHGQQVTQVGPVPAYPAPTPSAPAVQPQPPPGQATQRGNAASYGGGNRGY